MPSVLGTASGLLEGLIGARLPVARPATYRDGTHAGFVGHEYRIGGRLSEFDLKLVQMLVVAEDHRFFGHFGLDLRAILRASLANVRNHGLLQGASTIDQQLLKNTVLLNWPRLPRKCAEAVLAPVVDAILGKAAVLEHYLNAVYVGNGLYGLRTASLVFLGHDVDALSWGEAALLAGLPAAPERYAFYSGQPQARDRRNFVLACAARHGLITQAEAHAEMEAPLPPRRLLKASARDLSYRLAERLAGMGPVRLTLDRTLQQHAARVARRAASDSAFCSIASVDVATGEVLAATTEWSRPSSGYDVSLSPGLSPGSAVKPFTLAAALAAGWSATDRLPSGAVTLPTENGTWTVENWRGAAYGTPSLEEAMRYSDNTVYARLISAIGHDRVARLMSQCGLPALPSPGPTLTLGVLPGAIAPVDLAAAYSAFAEPGLVVEPIYDSSQTPRVRASPVSGSNAAVVRNVLRGYVQEYVPTAGLEAWGKTGTPDDGRVGWFVGVQKRVATAIAVASGAIGGGPAKAYEAALIFAGMAAEFGLGPR